MELVVDRAYRAFRFLIDKVIGNCAAFVMLAGTCLAIVEIVRRYLLGFVFEWGQDAVTYMLVSSIFLFFAVTQARRSHLAMSAAVDWLKGKGFMKLVLTLRAAMSLVSMTLFVSFAWWGIPTVERSAMMSRKTQSMVLELWPFQLCLLIGFALMAVAALFQLYQDVQAVRGKTVFPWAPVEEIIDI
jgi:TRAP-type C4-dicarboxylate transport system permease small subunit